MEKRPAEAVKAELKPTSRLIIAALMLLTFTTGVVDAVSLLGLGRVFTGNMTGNVVLLGFAIAGAAGFSLAASGISLIGFIAGAGVGGWMGRRTKVGPHGWLVSALIVEIVFMTVAAVLSIGLAVPTEDSVRFIVIFLLAAALGSRNAAVRDLGIKDLTTTVVTMTMTGLFADPSPGGGPGTSAFRRIGAIAAMGLGAVVGALMVIHIDLAVPLFFSAACAVVALVLVMRIERGERPGAPVA